MEISDVNKNPLPNVLCQVDPEICTIEWNDDNNTKPNYERIIHNNNLFIDNNVDADFTNIEWNYCDSIHNDSNEYKIFVGNVPYNCTQSEFVDCFKSLSGFVNAEIIPVYKTNISRGFGFVTMKNYNSAKVLKYRNDIFIKGRKLRFTSYLHTTDKNQLEPTSNYVYVDGIGENKTNIWLKELFSDYEPIGKCFVAMNQDTGTKKMNGVIEILDDEKFTMLLNKRFHLMRENITIEVSRYRFQIHSQDMRSKELFKCAIKTYHTRDPNYLTINAQNYIHDYYNDLNIFACQPNIHKSKIYNKK